MIIKTSRVPTGHTNKIAKYVAAKGENERVDWLCGHPDDIQIMGEISKLSGKAFSVRHVVLAPQVRLDHTQLAQVIKAYCQEYRVPDSSVRRLCLIRHVKPRASTECTNVHWHLAIPETDPLSLRVLNSSFTRIRDEKLSRMSELMLGHPIVPGRFTKQVFEALKKEQPNLDLAPYWKALEEFSHGASFSIIRDRPIGRAQDEENSPSHPTGISSGEVKSAPEWDATCVPFWRKTVSISAL